jgi:hypothetical protein
MATTATYTYSDRRKQLNLAAVKATKYEPDYIRNVKVIENVNTSLCMFLFKKKMLLILIRYSTSS